MHQYAQARAFKDSIYSCLKAHCDAVRARGGADSRARRHLFHLLTGASNSLLTAFPEVPGSRNYRPHAFLRFLHSHGLDPHPVHKPSSRRCCVLANAGEMLFANSFQCWKPLGDAAFVGVNPTGISSFRE